MIGQDSTDVSDRSHVSQVRPSDAPFAPQGTEITRRHQVFLYRDDASFLKSFSGFIKAALESGNAVVVVATDSHLFNLGQTLLAHGVNVATIDEGRYIPLSVVQTLAAFMIDGLPDRDRFLRVAGDLVRTAAPRASERDRYDTRSWTLNAANNGRG